MTRINTNLAALNSLRNLNMSHSLLGKSLQRLSTGLRVNSASDDPAALVISEKLRSQMSALKQAVDNSQRSQDMINTAEAALNEVNSLLVSMKELVLQAANDGANSAEEIDANQAQVDSAIESINRIANSTKFAGKHMLNGDVDYVTSGIAASIQEVNIFGAQFGGASQMIVSLDMAQSAQYALFSRAGAGTSAGSSITLQVSGNKGTEVITLAASTANSAIILAINAVSDSTGVSAVLSTTITSGIRFYSTELGSAQFASIRDVDTDNNGTLWINSRDIGRDAIATINGTQAVAKGTELSINTSMLKIRIQLKSGLNKTSGTETFYIKSGGLHFQLGDNTVSSEKQALGIQQMHSINLGDSSVGFLNELMTGSQYDLASDPDQAAKIIDAAIDDITSTRGRLGAFVSNTLHTNVNSLEVAIESITSSESRIRDVDFAAETANYTKAQILVQAGTSILAQANLVPQTVLGLLGGSR